MRSQGTEFRFAGSHARLPFERSPNLVPAVAASRPILTGPSVMRRAVAHPTILVFDSGLGGLTVYREVAKARPDARFVYAADDALFPYGAIEESRLIARMLELMEGLIAAYAPDLVVVACNTASTIALPALRARFAIPFVGTVPAIKPACAASQTKLVSVLGTEATVKREYTRALIREFAAGCEVKLVGSPRLAGFAEGELRGEAASDADIAAEIAPCFVEKSGRRTDTVALACTHYPLLLERLRAVSPWPVAFLDPAPAIARRVVELVGPATRRDQTAAAEAVFTSGRSLPVLADALVGFGIVRAENAGTPRAAGITPPL
jgi:glutamate racemase